MPTTDDYILGSEILHDRFSAATEIVGKLIASAPQAVSIVQLHALNNRPVKELLRLCDSLTRAGLLQPDPERRGAWRLACDPAAATLEDVFRCVMEDQCADDKPTPPRKARAGRLQRDVNLLVTQVTLAIHQSLYMHLRRFPLDRLYSGGKTEQANAQSTAANEEIDSRAIITEVA